MTDPDSIIGEGGVGGGGSVKMLESETDKGGGFLICATGSGRYVSLFPLIIITEGLYTLFAVHRVHGYRTCL